MAKDEQLAQAILLARKRIAAGHPDSERLRDALPGLIQQYDEPDEQTRAPPGRAATFARGLGQGLTLGFGDEIEAAGRSLWGPETYEQELDYVRDQTKQGEEANPRSSLAGEGAGILSTMLVPGMALAGGAKAGLGAAKLGKRVGAGAATGAGVGATDAVGRYEGDKADAGGAALRQGAVSGVLGGAIGAAAPSIVKGAASLMKKGKKGSETVKMTAAEKRFNKLAQDDNFATPGILADRLDPLVDVNRPAIIMDHIPGGSLARETVNIAKSPGPATAELSDFMNLRQVSQADRMYGDHAKALGRGSETFDDYGRTMGREADSFAQGPDAHFTNRALELNPEYEKAAGEALLPETLFAISDSVKRLGKLAPLRKDLKELGHASGRDIVNQKGEINLETIGDLDMLKKSIDGVYDNFAPETARAVSKLKADIVAAADYQSPTYMRARAMAAANKKDQLAYELGSGKKFKREKNEVKTISQKAGVLSSDVPIETLTKKIEKMSASEKQHLVTGVLDDVRTRLNAMPEFRNSATAFLKSNDLARLKVIMKDAAGKTDAEVDDLVEKLKLEYRMGINRNKTASMGSGATEELNRSANREDMISLLAAGRPPVRSVLIRGSQALDRRRKSKLGDEMSQGVLTRQLSPELISDIRAIPQTLIPGAGPSAVGGILGGHVPVYHGPDTYE